MVTTGESGLTVDRICATLGRQEISGISFPGISVTNSQGVKSVVVMASVVYLELPDCVFKVSASDNEAGLKCDIVLGGWSPQGVGADFPGDDVIPIEMDFMYLGEGAQEIVGLRYANSSRAELEPNELRVLVLELGNGDTLVFEGGWSFGLRVYSVPDPSLLTGLNDAVLSSV